MSGRCLLTLTGWLVTAAFLLAGIPLFLRMPLWCDVTLYDVAARTVLAGGILYRDVFDTNPPGFVWMLCGIRAFLGTCSEAIRAVDLGIVAIVVASLFNWARRAGASGLGIAWAAAACAAYYPFLHEFNHAQRDVWMMLPVVAAIGLRIRQVEREDRSRFPTILEGLLWGLGCWIKPHVVFIALAVWLATAARLASRRAIVRDLIAVVAGGLTAGTAGVAWLIASGTWPHFMDVWTTWNTSYAEIVGKELPFRIVTMQLGYFPPYSVCVLLAAPLALGNLRDCASADPARFRRAILAATYLAWLGTALLLQRPFHYVHIPETLLMLALFAANRWPVPGVLVLAQVAIGSGFLVADGNGDVTRAHRDWIERNPRGRWFVERHAAFDPERMRWWAGSFERDPGPEVRKGAGRYVDHFGGHDPVQLGAVAEYLRGENLRDGELIAWHDSPHALYLELGIRPGFRFMHAGTIWSLGPRPREALLQELQAALPRARFAVSDMHRITAHHAELAGPDRERLLPAWQREHFPFNQPVVFRSPGGRYLVHRIANPVVSCVIPDRLDQESPGN